MLSLIIVGIICLIVGGMAGAILTFAAFVGMTEQAARSSNTPTPKPSPHWASGRYR